MQIEQRNINDLIPYVRNARTHSDEQIAQLAGSIREFGWTNPILVDGENGLIAGHGRLLAARKLGFETVPVIELAHMTEAQKRAYILADNKLALNAGWDNELLSLELGDLQLDGMDLSLVGFSIDELTGLGVLGGCGAGDGTGEGQQQEAGKLADKFLIPPFSVISARDGWWQDRKRTWIAMGIRSEEGRGAPPGGSLMPCTNYAEAKQDGKGTRSDGYGKRLMSSTTVCETDWMKRGPDAGGSIFDPVLCELAYRWFSPEGGTILDPFAGGSVRGIVASKLGRQYIGVDLRPEQIEANRNQALDILSDENITPVWMAADSRNILNVCERVQADFLFSCPPYADLEVYSNDPADLSTLDYPDFKAAYFEIIEKSCRLLKQDRFAAFVVGEVRDKKTGGYYNFVGDTVEAFKAAGLEYYNEAILVTAVGSLPIRAGKQFSVSRKLGKTHQNILVFVKGDPVKAVAACGQVDVSEECFASFIVDNQTAEVAEEVI